MQRGTCLIDGKCYVLGESRDEATACWTCQPHNSMSNWTYGKSSTDVLVTVTKTSSNVL